MQKVPPHNLEAEMSVLGGLMLDPQAMDEIEGLLTPIDFYKPTHQKIFESIEHLYKNRQPFDIVMVSNHLSDRGEFDNIGGASALTELYEGTFSTANIQAYAQVVKDKSQLRKIITALTDLCQEAYEPQTESIYDFVQQMESTVYGLADEKTVSGLLPATDVIRSSIDRLEELSNQKAEVTGVPTGFVDLDKMTAGFQPQELLILAARPSMGKTALSLNIAVNSALRAGQKVAYFSLEMSKEQLMLRILASESQIDLSKLRIGKIPSEGWSKLIATAAKISESHLYIDDTSGISPFEILAKSRRLKNKKGLDLIIVDYIQLMDLKQKVESRERAVSEISKTLKKIAKELNVSMLALAQLNRSVEARSERRPVLSDLRESGSLEQDADVIMMIYREDYYEAETENKGIAEIIISKQRNGPVGTVKLAWKPQFGTFMNLAPLSMAPSNEPSALEEPPLNFV